MLPKLNRKRALFVLTKIDEILAWERTERGGAGYSLCRAWTVFVRSTGGAVLEAGEFEIV